MIQAFAAVLEREVLKLFRQRSRLLAALVRPLMWLLVIGTGFGAVFENLGVGDYKSFLVPGVVGMTMLFGAMLAALSTVYDKESGVMRMLVVAPLPHAWIVLAKAAGASVAALIQALILLLILALLGFLPAGMNWALLALGLVVTALACASLGMVIAAWSPTLENFAVIMNLVIFPAFFLSGSLYPVSHLPPVLRAAAAANPYSYGVDLLRHAMPGPASLAPDFSIATSLTVLLGFSAVALGLAGARFSRETAHEPLVRALSRKGTT